MPANTCGMDKISFKIQKESSILRRDRLNDIKFTLKAVIGVPPLKDRKGRSSTYLSNSDQGDSSANYLQFLYEILIWLAHVLTKLATQNLNNLLWFSCEYKALLNSATDLSKRGTGDMTVVHYVFRGREAFASMRLLFRTTNAAFCKEKETREGKPPGGGGGVPVRFQERR